MSKQKAVTPAKKDLSKLDAIEKGEAQPTEQLNFTNFDPSSLGLGGTKAFVLKEFKEIEDNKGDTYEAAVIEDKDGNEFSNGDLILLKSLKQAEADGKFDLSVEYPAFSVTFNGLSETDGKRTPYKKLTVKLY